MTNLIISYELDMPGKNKAVFEAETAALGLAKKILPTAYYVKTGLSYYEAAARIFDVIGSRDQVIVVEAANASMSGLFPETSEFIQAHWAK